MERVLRRSRRRLLGESAVGDGHEACIDRPERAPLGGEYRRARGGRKPVSETRVGQRTDYDRLTLTVETTDGRRVGKVLVVRNREPHGPEDDEADR